MSSRTVTERADWPRVNWQRVDASSYDIAVAALNDVENVDAVCAVLADAQADVLAREELIALVSMLVIHGVRTFETSDPQTVKRILDTSEAIAAGNIEVLAQ